MKKMKKMLVMLCAILGLTLGTFADTVKTCSISGTNGATVIASIIEVGDGYVKVELANDGETAVNVRVTVKKAASPTVKGSIGAIVHPQSSTTKVIPVSGAKETDDVEKYTIDNLSGTRCN